MERWEPSGWARLCAVLPAFSLLWSGPGPGPDRLTPRWRLQKPLAWRAPRLCRVPPPRSPLGSPGPSGEPSVLGELMGLEASLSFCPVRPGKPSRAVRGWGWGRAEGGEPPVGHSLRCSLRTPVAWGPRPHPHPPRAGLSTANSSGPRGVLGADRHTWFPGQGGASLISVFPTPNARTHMLVTAHPTHPCTQVHTRAHVRVHEQVHACAHTRTLPRGRACTHSPVPTRASLEGLGPAGWLRSTQRPGSTCLVPAGPCCPAERGVSSGGGQVSCWSRFWRGLWRRGRLATGVGEGPPDQGQLRPAPRGLAPGPARPALGGRYCVRGGWLTPGQGGAPGLWGSELGRQLCAEGEPKACGGWSGEGPGWARSLTWPVPG